MTNQDDDSEASDFSAREQLLYVRLTKGELVAALREAESWSSWPLDDIGLWLLVEAYFGSHRMECVPILERMLRTRHERDTLSVRRIEEMLKAASEWRRG